MSCSTAGKAGSQKEPKRNLAFAGMQQYIPADKVQAVKKSIARRCCSLCPCTAAVSAVPLSFGIVFTNKEHASGFTQGAHAEFPKNLGCMRKELQAGQEARNILLDANQVDTYALLFMHQLSIRSIAGSTTAIIMMRGNSPSP